MSSNKNKYKYINEGNAHIVLHVENSGYVIRIIKENGHKTTFDTVSSSVSFVNLVMVPLIFGSFMYFHEIIEMSAEEIGDLSVKLKQIRPTYRQVKSVFSNFAIKAPNLAMITPNDVNYCIELKPKEGFLPETLRRSPKCYYCLKQFLKLQEKQVKSKSDYCPLDLFSGNIIRMKRSLLNLLKNPQNNIKLFKNENIIFDEHSNIDCFRNIIADISFDSVNIFLDFIINILLNDGDSNQVLKETPEPTDEKPEKCIESKNLNTKSFLYKLLDVQKISQGFTIDTTRCETDEELAYVSILLSQIKEQNLDLTNETDRKKFFDIVQPEFLALISAVAKDCSIMISFSHAHSDNIPYIQVGDKKLFYRISVTDLEPKAAKTLVKRERTEKMLLGIYEKSLKP